ncbi:helix-turn-helix domain-containing protein [Halomarina litorea]|uniref:helix-turn-helix domain-containing protein n=1 Tax=Halomarina litorea TaxID=2961595 RepID=UPI003F6243A1
MREFVFAARYERGADSLMDVFISYPDLVGRALRIAGSSAGLWRVDRLVGPEDALNEVERVMTDHSVCNECLGEHPGCTIEGEYEVVAEGDESRLVYAYTSGGRYCHSIPFFTTQTVGNGALFDARRRENVYEWRVLLPGETKGGEIFDQLQDGLPKGVDISLSQVGSPSAWPSADLSQKNLPSDQRRAIEAAVECGYYGTPREASLGDVAAALDLPKSTLRYRLRRAEEWLTNTVFSEATHETDEG